MIQSLRFEIEASMIRCSQPVDEFVLLQRIGDYRWVQEQHYRSTDAQTLRLVKRALVRGTRTAWRHE